MKECKGTLYKINGKSYCVGERNLKKSKKSKKLSKHTKHTRVKLKRFRLD